MDNLCMARFEWSYILGEWGWVYIFYSQVGIGGGIFWVGEHFQDVWVWMEVYFEQVGVGGHIVWLEVGLGGWMYISHGSR